MKSESAAAASIRDTFLADHRRHEDLVARLLAAFEANDREQMATLWNDLDAGLTAHLEAEEKYLIPAVNRANPGEASAVLAEHAHLRARLTEIGTDVDLHIVRLETARSFTEELRAHARHEDNILYRWADEHVDPSERTSLLGALKDALRRRLSAIAEPAVHGRL